MVHHTLLIAVFIANLFALTSCEKDNVCTSFAAYFLKSSKNCYYNPDQTLEVPGIIKRYGFAVETHYVMTEDGYNLTMFRIPAKDPNAKVVFLQHGIYMSSIGFVDIGNKSLAFIMAHAGYDVWLGNFRGTRYCKSHIKYTYDDIEFWNFSYHELGQYDVKAQIDLVYEITNKKIIYIGYSMGSTTSYVYFILYGDEAAQKVDVAISLAPIAHLKNVPSIFTPFSPFWLIFKDIISYFTKGVVFKRTNSTSVEFCILSPINMLMCQFGMGLIFGIDIPQYNPETLPITLKQNHDAISTKVITHYAQGIVSRKFRYFDYKKAQNEKVYGQSTPPDYDLSKIKVKLGLYVAKNDLLSTVMNVNSLYENLPEGSRLWLKKIAYRTFAHADFVIGKNVDEYLYNDMVVDLKQAGY